jgi:hypothetical protein
VQTVVLSKRSILTTEAKTGVSSIAVAETRKPSQARAYLMADSNLAGQKSRRDRVRCSNCVEAGEFKAMAEVDSAEGHICARCGHMVLLSNPGFEGACAKCVGVRVF